MVNLGIEYPKTRWDDKQSGIVYATEQDTIIGYILYDRRSLGVNSNNMTVISAFVEPTHENTDVFDRMCETVNSIARDEGFKFITWSIHNRNSSLIESVKKNGYDSETFLMYKKV
jgi:hypothetical protein